MSGRDYYTGDYNHGSSVPLKNGNEYDALTKGDRRVHRFRAGTPGRDQTEIPLGAERRVFKACGA